MVCSTRGRLRTISRKNNPVESVLPLSEISVYQYLERLDLYREEKLYMITFNASVLRERKRTGTW